MDVKDYYTVSAEKGVLLTDKFYDAGLEEKRAAAELLITTVDLPAFYRNRLYDLAVKGLLQHSPRRSKARYPVRGVRKIRPTALAADRQAAFEALFANLDLITQCLNRAALPLMDTCNGPMRVEYTVVLGSNTEARDAFFGRIDPEQQQGGGDA